MPHFINLPLLLISFFHLAMTIFVTKKQYASNILNLSKQLMYVIYVKVVPIVFGGLLAPD